MKNLDKKNCITASIFYQSLGSSLHRCFTVKRENVQKPGSKEFNLYKSTQTRKVNREGVSIDLTVLFSMLFSMLLAFYTYIDRVYPCTNSIPYPNTGSILSSFTNSIPYPIIWTNRNFAFTVVVSAFQSKVVGNSFVNFWHIYKQPAKREVFLLKMVVIKVVWKCAKALWVRLRRIRNIAHYRSNTIWKKN